MSISLGCRSGHIISDHADGEPSRIHSSSETALSLVSTLGSVGRMLWKFIFAPRRSGQPSPSPDRPSDLTLALCQRIDSTTVSAIAQEAVCDGQPKDISVDGSGSYDTGLLIGIAGPGLLERYFVLDAVDPGGRLVPRC